MLKRPRGDEDNRYGAPIADLNPEEDQQALTVDFVGMVVVPSNVHRGEWDVWIDVRIHRGEVKVLSSLSIHSNFGHASRPINPHSMRAIQFVRERIIPELEKKYGNK